MENSQTTIAIRLVNKHHDGQMYGVVPYWYHLADVADSVLHAVGNDNELIAIAWNHDLREDTNCSYEEMEEAGLTRRVIDAVICLTKVEGESYDDYIKKVRSNPDALLVKKHDTLCNLTQSVKEGNSKRIKKYAKQLLLLEE